LLLLFLFDSNLFLHNKTIGRPDLEEVALLLEGLDDAFIVSPEPSDPVGLGGPSVRIGLRSLEDEEGDEGVLRFSEFKIPSILSSLKESNLSPLFKSSNLSNKLYLPGLYLIPRSLAKSLNSLL
jgi:hypothetical protein